MLIFLGNCSPYPLQPEASIIAGPMSAQDVRIGILAEIVFHSISGRITSCTRLTENSTRRQLNQ